MEELSEIELNDIEIDNSGVNVRTKLNDEGINDLTDIIKRSGFLKEYSILVRPKGDRYELVCGKHRCKAAEKAGLEKVWAWVKELTDEDALILSKEENNERSPLTSREEVKYYLKLSKLLKSFDAVCERTGYPEAKLKKIAQWGVLPDDILMMSEETKPGEARPLLTEDDLRILSTYTPMNEHNLARERARILSEIPHGVRIRVRKKIEEYLKKHYLATEEEIRQFLKKEPPIEVNFTLSGEASKRLRERCEKYNTTPTEETRKIVTNTLFK